MVAYASRDSTAEPLVVLCNNFLRTLDASVYIFQSFKDESFRLLFADILVNNEYSTKLTALLVTSPPFGKPKP